MKNKIFFTLITLGAIAISPIAHIKPAQASLSDAAKFLDDNWGSIVSNAWSPFNKQVFMTNLSSQETKSVQEQYRSRANGVLTDRCINKVADTYYTGWRKNAIKTAYRWTIAMRVENGVANCYQRMPNRNADNFMRRRGW